MAALVLGQTSDPLKNTSQFNVVWDSPSLNSLGSMPVGNGDIGMNVWVEAGGDLYIYLSKTDAWSENGQLLKLGKIRISLDPSPFVKGKPFRQELELTDGEIVIRAGKPAEETEIRVRVDANNPVAEISINSKKPVAVKAELQPWRTARREISNREELVSVYGLESTPAKPVWQEADHFIAAKGNRLAWYHRNDRSVWQENMELQALGEFAAKSEDPLFFKTFGAVLEGDGLVASSPMALASAGKLTACTISLYPHTMRTVTEQDWLNRVDYGIALIKKQTQEKRIAAHRKWWADFWNRSWIFVTAADETKRAETEAVTRGYILQRYINACGGRGGSPIKFNGSIFTVDTYNRTESKGFDADFRRWGGPFWFQNTRLPYWSMLEAGDTEMMKPLFDMYMKALPLRQFATKKYYGHTGAFFPETMNFWGTWTNVNYGTRRTGMPDGLTENTYIRYYWTCGLELAVMMLDYYDFTGSESFAKDTLVPFVTEVLEFFDKHWHKGIEGKILFTPAQALETYQTAVNPTPDVAGLRFVTAKMLGLGNGLVAPELRKKWEALAAATPEIPMRTVKGQQLIAPASYAAQEANIENPELYAIFPFRLYGVGKPGTDLAINTFVARKFRQNIGWQHSAIQAACLGLAREAASLTAEKFLQSDPACRFPAFWGPNYDWSPDQDHGTVAMIALQWMLLQYEGDSLTTFPAWPEEWDVEFRLHGTAGRVVTGSCRGGMKTSDVRR